MAKLLKHMDKTIKNEKLIREYSLEHRSKHII